MTDGKLPNNSSPSVEKVRLKKYQKPLVALLVMSLSPLLAGFSELPILKSPDNKLRARFSSFQSLTNWQNDQHDEALTTFKRSCAVMKRANQTKQRPGFTGTYSDWIMVCKRAHQVPLKDQRAAQKYFEENFVPAQILHNRHKGMFTGYYEPELSASLTKSAEYSVPLYRKPKDLIKARRAKKPANWNRKITAGRMQGGMLQPYYSRAEIEQGALKSRRLEFVYLKSWVDAFFLHIQGSGRLFLKNGKVLRVGFAAKKRTALYSDWKNAYQAPSDRAQKCINAIYPWLA